MSTEASVATEKPTEESNVEVSSVHGITAESEKTQHWFIQRYATPVTNEPSEEEIVALATKVPNSDTIVAPEIVE